MNPSSTLSTSSNADATISISHKARGTLLDVVKMTATVPEDPGHEPRATGHRPTQNEEQSELNLTFEDGRCMST